MASESSTSSKLPGKILVIGASGLLGSRLVERLSSKYQVFGTYMKTSLRNEPNHFSLDVTDSSSLEALVSEVRPGIVINCSGFTSVESCENRPETCWLINTISVAKMAKLLSHHGIRLIQIGTDHYESSFNAPRKEFDDVRAVNQYGYSKLVAEKEVLLCNPKNLVLRVNFFGSGRFKNETFWDSAISSINVRKSVIGFRDIQFSPVSIEYLAKIISLLISRQDISGIRNIASEEVKSKFEFLIEIARQLNRDLDLIQPINSKQLPNRALRPSYLALDPTLICTELSLKTPSLAEMIRQEIVYRATK